VRRDEEGEHVPLGALLVEMGRLVPSQLVRLLDDIGLTGFQLQEDAVRLAAHFHRAMGDDDRLILFTSPTESSDSSAVCTQLSLAMALMGQGPILVIDANLRSPSVHEKFRFENSPGLAELVSGTGKLKDTIRTSGLKGLDLLTAGETSGDMLACLLSETCDTLLQELRQTYRFVLINTPPVLEHPEAALLGSKTDGAVVIVREKKQRRTQLAEVARVLKGLNVKVYGSVLATHGKAKATA